MRDSNPTPKETPQVGSALRAALEAVERLADLRRPRAPVLYRSKPRRACPDAPYREES
jgi:hypothetical protein